MSHAKDPAAVALGKRRWAGVSEADRIAAATAAAEARNRKLTPERQRAIALKASKAAAKAARKRRAEKKSAARKAKARKG